MCMDKAKLRHRFIWSEIPPPYGLLIRSLLCEAIVRGVERMNSNFQVNSTVAAKDLMRSRNPESLTFEELHELKQRCEFLLSEIWKIVGSKKYSSSPERISTKIIRSEMEMFIARISELIANYERELTELETAPPAERHHPKIF